MGAKLLSLVPKSLTSYGATNTQIGATSTQLAKGWEKSFEGIYICSVEEQIEDVRHRKIPDWYAFLFEGMYSEYVWNFDNAIEGMYLRTTVQLS